MIAEIYISLKKPISDPQGLTVRHALESLGYKDLADVRIGKLVNIKLNSKNKKIVRHKIDGMCKKLLVTCTP